MTHGIAQFCQSHPVFCGAVVMAFANAAVTAMPPPRSDGSQFYAWAFNFLHGAVGAIARIAAQYKSNGASVTENNNPPKVV